MGIDVKEVGVLKVEEAARILGISRQTAYNLAQRDELPGIRRLGGRWIVLTRVLEEFLEGN
jgi:excisionase family DNA binding protein